jgi:hypothetical protein
MLVGLSSTTASARDRYWQPRSASSPYGYPNVRQPGIGIAPLVERYNRPGIGYPSFAPQPGHVEAQIAHWYAKYLGRQVSPEEIHHWMDYLVQRGTVPEIQIGIMASPECFQRCQSDPGIYVQFLFTQITGREPDPRELHYWVSLLHHRFQGERRDFCRALVNAIG